MEPDITKSALIIVDMQNTFAHKDGWFCQSGVDVDFVLSPISNIKRLAGAFRAAGRPVVYLIGSFKSDYSDAFFSYPVDFPEKQVMVEGTWSVQIVDELKPQEGEHIVIKKGFGGFCHTPLDGVLRNLGVNTCVMTGIATNVCVSSTLREGTYYGYRMIIVSDGTSTIDRETHEAELRSLGYIFAEVKTTEEVLKMLFSICS